MCMADAREGYKRVWGPMEVRGDVRSPGLELLMVVSHMWALGTKPRSSGGVSCKLFLNAELSLAPHPPLFLVQWNFMSPVSRTDRVCWWCFALLFDGSELRPGSHFHFSACPVSCLSGWAVVTEGMQAAVQIRLSCDQYCKTGGNSDHLCRCVFI